MPRRMKGSQLSVMTPVAHLEIDIQPGIDDAGNEDAHEKDGGCRRDRMIELGLGRGACLEGDVCNECCLTQKSIVRHDSARKLARELQNYETSCWLPGSAGRRFGNGAAPC